MTTERYVVLGLASARSPWFESVSRWATTGSLPLEFLKCVSVEELRARVDSGRPFSAVLLEGRLTTVDRDLIAEMADRSIASIIVTADDELVDWLEVGANATLPSEFDRSGLLDALVTHGRMITDVTPSTPADEDPGTGVGWLAPLIALTGRSGSGVSTLAIALAQQLGGDPRYAGGVLLADLVRHAHQAVLHDVRDIVPGIQEVMDLHRNHTPSEEEVRRLTYVVPGRGYRLLLGLRHPRDWVGLRARSLEVTLDSLRRGARLVIADTDPELSGEAETGSFDLEDRHLLGRRTILGADLVVLVATPTMTGLHGLALQLADLRHHGVTGDRLLVVLNRAPRGARSRAELARAVNEITGNRNHPDPFLGPVFVPERRGIDTAHRDLAPMPAALCQPLGTAVLRALERTDHRRPMLTSVGEPEPVPIATGSLGHWEVDG